MLEGKYHCGPSQGRLKIWTSDLRVFFLNPKPVGILNKTENPFSLQDDKKNDMTDKI